MTWLRRPKITRKRAYSVGYGKPPAKTKFKPGASGNPKGRPRGSKNFSMVIEEELSEHVAIIENGRQKRFSKGKVVAKQLVNQAATGDPKAMQTLISATRSRGAARAAPVAAPPEETPEKKLVIADIVRRILAADNSDLNETLPTDTNPKPRRG